MAARTPTGIVRRHSRSCSRQGRCECPWEAWVWSRADGKKIQKRFSDRAAAKGWRTDALKGVKDKQLRAPTQETLKDAALAWLGAAERGEILSRHRRPYKPSTLRGYRADLETYVYDDLGSRRLADVDYADLQGLVDRLVTKKLSGSKVRNVIVPLQAIYRRRRREIPVDPTNGLELPAPSERRERVASVEEADKLLAALPQSDRAVWATAFYAGLRRGELRALRWSDMDDMVTIIHVQRGYDDKEGEIEPKSVKGSRKVPVSGELRSYLLDHKLRTGRRGSDYVFGRTATEPFTPSHVRRQAVKVWTKAKLGPIGLHECRHTYVSLMFDAGLSLERIGDYVGHASSYMTDRYRHLLDGHEQEAADALDLYLAKRRTGAQNGAHALQAASVSQLV